MKKLQILILIKTFFEFIIILLFTGCSTEPIVIDPETTGDYYVFCELNPKYKQQQVLVGKTVPENYPIDVTDAVVTIQTDSQLVHFIYLGKGYYADIYTKLRVTAGTTYHLKVKLPNRNMITGIITTPGPFEILIPASGDTITHYLSRTLDTLALPRIEWSASTGVLFYVPQLYVDDDTISANEHSTNQTTAFMPELEPRISWNDSLSGEKIVAAKLVVIAYDSTHLPNYWHEDVLHERTNVIGGLGTFQSVSMTSERNFFLKIYMDWP